MDKCKKSCIPCKLKKDPHLEEKVPRIDHKAPTYRKYPHMEKK